MKQLLSFLILMLVAGGFTALQAQDKIYLVDGSEIEAKVTAIDDKKVTYVLFTNQDGPKYYLERKEALLIVYENGTHEIVSTRIDIAGEKAFRRNIFAYHLFDLTYNDFSLSYERLNKDGTLGWQIPVRIGYGDTDIRDYQNIFSSGLGLNFYPTGQGVWRYFMGPAIEAGIARDAYYYYDEVMGDYIENNDEYFYGRLVVNNGVMFMPINSFHISATAGLGVRYLSGTEYSDDQVRTTFQFSLNLGYRF